MGSRGGSSGMRSGANNAKLMDKINAMEQNILLQHNPIPYADKKDREAALDYHAKMDYEKKKNAPIENVPIESIRKWQDYIRPETLKAIAFGDPNYSSSSDLPRRVRINGNVIVMDGNHRTAVAYMRGDKSVKMRVIEYKERKRRR